MATGAESVTLTWTAPGDDDHQGRASQYDLRCATYPITLSNWYLTERIAGVPAPQEAGSRETMTVNGLSPGLTYYFAIKSADEALNWSPMSNVVQVETTPFLFVVDDLAVGKGPAKGELRLNWAAPGSSESGPAAGYEIRLDWERITADSWADARVVGSTPVPAFPGKMEVFDIGGLLPGHYYYVAIRCRNGSGVMGPLSNAAVGQVQWQTATDVDAGDNLPGSFRLSQNYPNPFNSSTVIEYSLPAPAHVELAIYNMAGRLVRMLAEGLRGSGQHSTAWDGTDSRGKAVATGTYFYVLRADGFRQSKKMLLLK